MALQKTSLFTGPTTLAQTPRMHAEKLLVARFSTGTEELPVGAPVAFDSSAQKWVPYTQPSDAAIYTITAGGTAASAGTFELMVDGLSAVFAFDVAAAAMQTELNALLADAGKGYTVACAATTGTDLGDNSAVITITFGEGAGAPSVDLDASGLTGSAHVLAASDAGTQLNDSNKIRGFVYERAVQLDDTDDVHGLVLVRGEVYASDVNTSAIRAALRGSPSEGEVQAALKEAALGDRIMVRGLAGAF